MKVLVACEVSYYKSGKNIGKKIYWCDSIGGKDKAHIRSRTFPGIARAMADQWG